MERYNEMKTGKKEHPRLFFNREELEDIREKIRKSPFKERWELFIRNADYISKHLVNGIFDFVNNVIKDNRSVTGLAGICAFAYAVTKDNKYAKSAIQAALDIAGKSKNFWYSKDEKMFSYNKGATLTTAHFSLACGLVYDWCYEAMSDEEREIVRTALVDKGIAWYFESVRGTKKGFTDEGRLNLQDSERRDWWVDNFTSNWGGVIHGCIGTAALAIMDEEKAAWETVEYAGSYVPSFTGHVVSEDGGSDEGVMYALYGLIYSISFMMAAERNVRIDRTALNSLNENLFGYWAIYMQGPDGKFANFNNMDEGTFEGIWSDKLDIYESWDKLDQTMRKDRIKFEGGPDPSLAALFESFVPGGDTLLLWAADNWGAGGPWMGISPFYFIWRRTEAPLQQVKPELQKSVLFRGNGHMIVRSDVLWLAYNGGRISNESHRNFDLGTLILKLKDDVFICDPGYGKVETYQHSTVMVDGLGQKSGGKAHYTKYVMEEEYTYFASDLTKSYISDEVKKVERHFVIVRGQYLLIIDQIQGYEDLNIELRFQTQKSIQCSENRAIIHGKNQDLCILSAGNQNVLVEEGASWNKDSEEGEFRFVRINPMDNQKDCILVTLLYPVKAAGQVPGLQFRDDCGIIEILNPDLSKDTVRIIKEKGTVKVMQVNESTVSGKSMHRERSIIPYRESE